jgi:hypothetical protein
MPEMQRQRIRAVRQAAGEALLAVLKEKENEVM